MSSRPWSDQERNFLATSWHQAWEAPRAAGGFREPAPGAQSSAGTSPPLAAPTAPLAANRRHASPQNRKCFILRGGVWGQPPSRLSGSRLWGEAALEVNGVGTRSVLGIRSLVAAALAARVASAAGFRGGRVENHHVSLRADVLSEPHGLVATLRPPLLCQDGPHGRRAAPVRGRRRGLWDPTRGLRAGRLGLRGLRLGVAG